MVTTVGLFLSVVQKLLPDTITAIATPLGVGGVGIIRLSGPEALVLGQLVFSGLTEVVPRMVHFGQVVHPDSGQVLDEGCFIYFKGPHSFTGEDVVELQLHSNPALLQRILTLLIEKGARLATGGEFTKRAFIHGKMSLEKAESIIDLIHADSTQAQDVALSHFDGKLFKHLAGYRAQLMLALEQVEASIDFPDEVETLDKADFLAVLSGLQAHVREVIALEDYGRVVRDGISCAIVGRPNVGKSSFLNHVLGHERAIVSGQAGTTRDYIEADVAFEGLRLRFVDTAGIRESSDDIERSGIEKLADVLKLSDCVLWLCDGSEPLTTEDHAVKQALSACKTVVVVLTKSDKGAVVAPSDALFSGYSVFPLSNMTGTGVLDVKQHIAKLFTESIDRENLSLLCNVRQIACLKSLDASLVSMRRACEDLLPDDMLSVDLKAAIETLGELTGDALTEEVLDGIFSRFCIGK